MQSLIKYFHSLAKALRFNNILVSKIFVLSCKTISCSQDTFALTRKILSQNYCVPLSQNYRLCTRFLVLVRMRSLAKLFKGVVDCFFLGLIVFMGCSLTCVNASFF